MTIEEVKAKLLEADTALGNVYDALTVAMNQTTVANTLIAQAALAIPEPTPPPPPPTPLGATVGAQIRTSEYIPGWSHTDEDPKAMLASDPRVQLLKLAAPLQGQHQQGFGLGALQPTQGGPVSFAGMDRLFGQPGNPSTGYMRDAKYRALFTCAFPAWMKAPVPGTTITQNIPLGDPKAEFIYTPPHRSQYPAAVKLVVQEILRYPQITHVVPWNEWKGYWFNNRWDYEDICEFHNQLYVAVKKARPEVQVGSPYGVLRTMGWREKSNWSTELKGPWGAADVRVMDAMQYLLNHMVDCDFFCMDIRNSNFDYAQNDRDANKFDMPTWLTNPEKGINPTFWPNGSDPWSSCQKLFDIMAWYRSQPRLNNKPFWMMEVYPNARVNNFNTAYADHPESSPAEMASVAAEMMRCMAVAGFAGALQWRVQGESLGKGNPLSLWRSDGTPTRLVSIYQTMWEQFSEGKSLLKVDNLPPGISAIASPTHLMAISANSTSTSLRLDGQDMTLGPYEVRPMVRV